MITLLLVPTQWMVCFMNGIKMRPRVRHGQRKIQRRRGRGRSKRRKKSGFTRKLPGESCRLSTSSCPSLDSQVHCSVSVHHTHKRTTCTSSLSFLFKVHVLLQYTPHAPTLSSCINYMYIALLTSTTPTWLNVRVMSKISDYDNTILLSLSIISALVVLTSLGGYTMAPGAVDPATLLWAVTGTALCSASANSFNQWKEVPYDSLMTRTKNRVLVRKMIR